MDANELRGLIVDRQEKVARKMEDSANMLGLRIISNARVAAIKQNVRSYTYKLRSRNINEDELKLVRTFLRLRDFGVSMKRGLLNTTITIAW